MIERYRDLRGRRIPFVADVAAELANAHAWRVVLHATWADTRVTALNVDPASIALLEEHGFRRFHYVKCVGGPRREGPRVNMRAIFEPDGSPRRV